jgi:hypothetical protein
VVMALEEVGSYVPPLHDHFDSLVDCSTASVP